jgi:lactaldehyde reductase
MAERFVLNETSYFGRGCREVLPEEIKSRGYNKVLVVTDKSLTECGLASKVTSILDNAGIAYEVYNDVKPNPTVTNVKNGLAKCRECGADVIVAVGGGSAMDTAKAISIIMTNPDREDVENVEQMLLLQLVGVHLWILQKVFQ